MPARFSDFPSSKAINFKLTTIASFTALSVILSGCSAFPAYSHNNFSEFTDKVDPHGTLPVMHHEFNQLPLVEMLEGIENKNDAKCLVRKNNEFDPVSYQCATKLFYDRTRPLPDSAQRMERNRIQERILAVSEDRCNAYKRYLRYDQSMSNFWLGFGSTLSGGLGALSNTLTAAKTFAAFGGVLSGISAEYNQDFYGNLFYSVITKSIDEQRSDAYRQIQTYGQGKSLAEYPVEAAIKDAIIYDGTCSAVSAMEYAEKAVHLVNDPGMDGMMRYLIKANQSRYILQNGVKDISELKSAGITTTYENSRFGSQISSNENSALNPQSNIQTELYTASQQTAENIVKSVGQQYAGNDKNKVDAWKNRQDLTQITKLVDEKLTPIVNDLKKRLSECLVPATNSYVGYLQAESSLQQAKDDQITANKIKRDQAQNNVVQINVKISGITQQFQTLIESLTKSVLQSASNNQNVSQLNWEYSPDVQLKSPVCQ